MSEIQDRIKLEPTWKKVLGIEFEKEYMQELRNFLLHEKRSGKTIYPTGGEIFNAFNLTPFDRVKVVILGQDPYHGPGQAHGLCFSVKPGIAMPPSLQSILQEIQNDLNITPSSHGCLESWARQGVLLLNSVLTVEKYRAASHQGRGWEQFTDHVIQMLAEHYSGLVFLLWGSYAQQKGRIIDTSRHLVLESPHPSPLSAHRGFFGNRHFSKTNAYLLDQSKEAINWDLSQNGETEVT